MADAKLLSVEFLYRNVSAVGDDPAAEEVVQPYWALGCQVGDTDPTGAAC
jgi:hypothetical protein